MSEPRKPKEVRCVSMGTQKLLAIDWGDGRRALRLYYPNGVGGFYFDEIEFNGDVFVVRSGKASDVKLEHNYVEWEQKYKPNVNDSAIMYFEKAYKEPWWTTFRDAWNTVTSLCPVKIE
jgi:hypothetical protein